MFKRIVRQSTLYFFAIASRGIAFLLLPLYVRTLTTEEIGVYELFNAISLLLAVILPLEITQAVAKLKTNNELSEERKKNQSAIALTFTVVSFGCFVVTALVLIALLGSKHLYTSIHVLVPILAITLLLFNGIYYFLQNELRWLIQSRTYLKSTAISSIVTISVSFLLLKISNLGIIGLYLALNIGAITGIVIIYLKNPNLINFRWEQDELITMIKFSFPLTISSALIIFSSIVDRFVLSLSLDLDALGRYGVAVRVSGLAMAVFQGMQLAILPIILVQTDHASRKKNLEISLRYFLIIGSTVTLILSAITPEIMLFIVTAAYTSGSKIVPLILIGSLFSATYPLAPGLWLRGLTWRMTMIGMILAILSIILSVTFISILGELGAAMAFALSGIAYATLMIFFSDKAYPINRNYKKLFLSSMVYISGGLWLSVCISQNITIEWRILSAIILIYIIIILLSTGDERTKVFAIFANTLKSIKNNVK